MKRAVFLDRDGTLMEEKEYLHRPEEVSVFPGAGAALKSLNEAGFLLFIVSNQSGVGRGYFTLADVAKVHERLTGELARAGAEIKKIYVAPEAPGQPSRARKPSPQFLFDARDELGVDLAESYMIGDKLIDMECGWNAGVKRSILVKTGYGMKHVKVALGIGGTTQARKKGWKPALVAEDVGAAAEWILGEQR
jgi:D-glycero-D-manno-heptose 1,7-bisphosphate phosphatase